MNVESREGGHETPRPTLNSRAHLYESGLTVATTYTLTGSLLDAGVPFTTNAQAWVALANADALIDGSTDAMILGRWPLTLGGSGEFTLSLPATASGAGYMPDGGFAYQLYVWYRDSAPKATRITKVSEPFTLTANSTLADVLGGTIELRSVSAAEWADFQAKYDEMPGLVSDAETARDEAVAAAELAVAPTADVVNEVLTDPASDASLTLSATIGAASPKTGFVMESVTEAATTTYAPVGSIDGVIYARHLTTGGLHRSTDNGVTWSLVNAGITAYGGLHATGDGEVIANCYGTLRKSSGWSANPVTATWTTVATANGTSSFIDSNVDAYDNIVIAAEYAVPRDDARFVKVSTDYGATFTNVRDLTAMWPANVDDTHWHAVAIDPWYTGPNPRLWISHGDGPRGVYYSDNLGTSWTEYGTPDTWQPMPLAATPNGIVTSTDQNPDGIWLIPRDLSPKVQLAKIIKPFWQGSLLGFGTASHRDDVTGIVYILFRADQQLHFTEGNRAIIFATDGVRADIIYETAQTGTVGVSGSVNFEGRPALTADGHLLVTYLPPTGGRRIIKGTVRRGSLSSAARDGGNALTGKATERSAIGIGYGVAAAGRNLLVGEKAGTALLSTDDQVTLIGQEAIGGNRGTGLGFQAVGAAHSVSVGYTASAGPESVVIGSQAAATGRTGSVVIGRSAAATAGDGQVVIGKGASTSLGSTVAIGWIAQVSSVNGVALGYDARVNAVADGAVAIGTSSRATGVNSVAIGKDTNVNGSHALGIGPRHIEVGKFTAASEPGNSPAATARVFVKDNGSGKMQLGVRFPTGATVVLATEA